MVILTSYNFVARDRDPNDECRNSDSDDEEWEDTDEEEEEEDGKGDQDVHMQSDRYTVQFDDSSKSQTSQLTD